MHNAAARCSMQRPPHPKGAPLGSGIAPRASHPKGDSRATEGRRRTAQPVRVAGGSTATTAPAPRVVGTAAARDVPTTARRANSRVTCQ
eukprot:6505852-Prymnesium_polylepis.1